MFAVQGNANPLNSTEYAALDARIGDLSDLTTSDKSSVVGAVNVLNSKIATINDWDDITSSCSFNTAVTGTSGKVYVNRKTKQVFINFTIAAGTGNGTNILTLPSDVKIVAGMYLGGFRYESNGNVVGYLVGANQRSIVTSYTMSVASLSVSAVDAMLFFL